MLGILIQGHCHRARDEVPSESQGKETGYRSHLVIQAVGGTHTGPDQMEDSNPGPLWYLFNFKNGLQLTVPDMKTWKCNQVHMFL